MIIDIHVLHLTGKFGWLLLYNKLPKNFMI